MLEAHSPGLMGFRFKPAGLSGSIAPSCPRSCSRLACSRPELERLPTRGCPHQSADKRVGD